MSTEEAATFRRKIEDIFARINAALRQTEVPGHVAHRIGHILGDPDKIQLIDAQPGHVRGLEAGEVTIFTDKLVIAATWECTDGFTGPESVDGVRVEAWSRRTLRSIAIVPGEDMRNSDTEWQTHSMDGGWPGVGQLTLRYEGRPDLLLPRNPRTAGIAELLPSLVDDVG